ncbi:MAG: hypothetical protein US10_C0002G0026, partial [Candidatus Moranbacteria bacterium GW2011_GWD2_36_198]
MDSPYKNSETLKVDGVFAEIGSDPNVDLIKNLEIELDEQGYVKIDTSG